MEMTLSNELWTRELINEIDTSPNISIVINSLFIQSHGHEMFLLLIIMCPNDYDLKDL